VTDIGRRVGDFNASYTRELSDLRHAVGVEVDCRFVDVCDVWFIERIRFNQSLNQDVRRLVGTMATARARRVSRVPDGSAAHALRDLDSAFDCGEIREIDRERYADTGVGSDAAIRAFRDGLEAEQAAGLAA